MSTVLSKDGTRIAFDRIGTGDPVILVDGAMCYRTFGPMGALAPLLAQHFTVFTYDRRGRGESGDTLPYDMMREVEDIAALINEAGGSAFVYGLSSGGALSLLAAAAGLPITKLALYEIPFMLDDSGLQAAHDYTTNLTKTLAQGRRGDAIELFMQRVGMPAEAIAGTKQAPVWSMFEAIAPTLAYDDTIMGDSVVPADRAAAINVPTLVMSGGASPLFLQDAAQVLETMIINAEYRVLEGQTHDVSAEAIAPVLTAFFSR